MLSRDQPDSSVLAVLPHQQKQPLPQHTPWGRAEHPPAEQQQVTAGCSEPTRTSGQLQPCYRYTKQSPHPAQQQDKSPEHFAGWVRRLWLQLPCEKPLQAEMHESYLHVTDKQGELRWLSGFLILQETPDCSLPLGRAHNHTPTAGRALSLPKCSLHRLLWAQVLPGSCFGNAASCRLLLQLPPALPQGWHADSTTEIKTAPRREGGEKKNKTASPKSFSVFAPCSPEPADPPLSALMHRTTQLRSEAGGITGSWGTCTSNDMISETLQKSQTTAKK